MIAVLSVSFAEEEEALSLADEILSSASEGAFHSALSLCVTANVEQRGGKWEEGKLEDQPQISPPLNRLYSPFPRSLFHCRRFRKLHEKKRLPPHSHPEYWLYVIKCAQYGGESRGCRAEVFNFRIKCSLYEMLLTSSRPLLQRGDAASSQQRWLRRMAECSVEQALESQLYSRLAYCCVRPSLSPFVSLDFPSPQAPQLMPHKKPGMEKFLYWVSKTFDLCFHT